MVIGKKSKPVGFMYVATVIVFLIMLLVIADTGAVEAILVMLIFGAIMLTVNGIILYLYVKTPDDAIILNYDKSITLPGYDVTISMSEVTDISYRRASARGVQYKWGKVVISTYDNKYTVRYLCECEKVAKTLTQEMYEYKYRERY